MVVVAAGWAQLAFRQRRNDHATSLRCAAGHRTALFELLTKVGSLLVTCGPRAHRDPACSYYLSFAAGESSRAAVKNFASAFFRLIDRFC